MRSLGSSMIDDYWFRDSWAMITIKGRGWALAEGLDDNGDVVIEVTI